MARPLMLRHAQAPEHLIEVAVKWPRSLWTESASTCDNTTHEHGAHTAPNSTEALATYRRCRQALADALRPRGPADPPLVADGQTAGTRLAQRGWDRWSASLLPGSLRARKGSRKAGPSVEEESAVGSRDEAVAPETSSIVDLFAPDVLAAATALYDPTLPYHNATHALRAVAAGERLMTACSDAGVPVDATVVRLALLFHDAGYGTDVSTVGCPDSESYAAALARDVLTDRVSASLLDDIEGAILATRCTTEPDTAEGKLVRAADLADLAADYQTFAANSESLRLEQERLSGTPVAWPDWRDSVGRLLGNYLDEPLWPLGLLDEGSACPGFHAAAKANLNRYLGQAG